MKPQGIKLTIQRYLDAGKEYVEREKSNKDVIGIILPSDHSYANLDKNSDIDVYVVLDPSCDYRVRGNVWINGVEVEYFKNPPAQIRAYFENEKSPLTAHMLAYGQIAYSRSDTIEALVSSAKEIMEQQPPKLHTSEIEIEKYFIDDYRKDLEDAITNQDFLGSNIIRNKIINRSIDVFFKLQQIRRPKDKGLRKQIDQLDSSYSKTVELAIDEKWDESSSIENLITETEALLGGRRSKEWELRSRLDL